MVFLLLAILCGSLFSIVFKLGQRSGVDGLQVILFNYSIAFLFTLLPIAAGVAFDPSVAVEDYIPHASAWLLALVQGVFFLTGFSIMDRSTRESGVALTTVCARAALILPVVLSWLLLGQPAPSWLAVILTVAAMVLIIGPTGKAPAGRQVASRRSGRYLTMLGLAGVFVVFGLSDFFLKVVQHSVSANTADAALVDRRLSALTCIIFFMASAASLMACLLSGSFRRKRVGWNTVGWGALLGIVNIGCTLCMLKALAVMPTGVFYPLYNIGIVLVATLAGLLFFGERLKWVQAAGLALAVAAIAFSF